MDPTGMRRGGKMFPREDSNGDKNLGKQLGRGQPAMWELLNQISASAVEDSAAWAPGAFAAASILNYLN